MRKIEPNSRRFIVLLRCIVVGIFIFTCGCRNGDAPSSADRKSVGHDESNDFNLTPIQKLVSSEELILELTNRLGPLNRSAENLVIDTSEFSNLFADHVKVMDVRNSEKIEPIDQFIEIEEWVLSENESHESTRIFERFFQYVDYLETAKFYFIDGQIDPKSKIFNSTLGFASHFLKPDGTIGFAKSRIKVKWDLAMVGNLKSPRIVEWETESFKLLISRGLMFEDVTAATVLDSKLAEELATSVHEEMTTRLIRGESIRSRQDQGYKLFFPEVTLEHPAVSVVDIDSDGWDDFFLSRPHEPSLMFLNQGDGTFEEIGEQVGLRLAYDCTCALFADYDNDGDQDVFIGRARHRAVYLQNKGGSFSESSESIRGVKLPYMVSSICAADYDKNGLLDVYFSTYSPIEGSHADILQSGNIWPSQFLSAIEQVEFSERRATAHPYIDMVGPPNMLLKNVGERFELSEHNFDVESWRKSFQSSWCDFDQDGDQDLYVCNDFSPDDLYRNESGQGFTRVSEQVGLNQLGFGMGVSWNDYNNDGQFDLYVSNMYSKAGARISSQIAGLDPSIGQMAQGNYLYAFDGKKFRLESLNGPQRVVAQTGWSWGGQLTDLDNDGQLDIVVANGYYSAPGEVATKVDL